MTNVGLQTTAPARSAGQGGEDFATWPIGRPAGRRDEQMQSRERADDVQADEQLACRGEPDPARGRGESDVSREVRLVVIGEGIEVVKRQIEPPVIEKDARA